MLHQQTINQLLLLDELKNVNKVTKESIKTYKGLEYLTDEQANSILMTLETLSEILLNQAQRNLL